MWSISLYLEIDMLSTLSYCDGWFRFVNTKGVTMDANAPEKDLLSDAVLSEDPPALPEEVGELAIDVFDDGENLVIKAPMAGVRPSDLELSITEDAVAI